MLQMKIANGRSFRDEMGNEAIKARKASMAAAKVEGYRLMRLMKDELRQAAPGGNTFSPLSVIRSGKLTGGRNPLSKMAFAPRYATVKQIEQTKTMIGFLSIKLSKSWMRLAEKHQDGFSVDPDSFAWGGTTLRKLFARQGARIKDKAVARYYFLRKSTKELKTPARMIVQPFWAKHQTESAQQIVSNFERKMRGERI